MLESLKNIPNYISTTYQKALNSELAASVRRNIHIIGPIALVVFCGIAYYLYQRKQKLDNEVTQEIPLPIKTARIREKTPGDKVLKSFRFSQLSLTEQDIIKHAKNIANNIDKEDLKQCQEPLAIAIALSVFPAERESILYANKDQAEKFLQTFVDFDIASRGDLVAEPYTWIEQICRHALKAKDENLFNAAAAVLGEDRLPKLFSTIRDQDQFRSLCDDENSSLIPKAEPQSPLAKVFSWVPPIS